MEKLHKIETVFSLTNLSAFELLDDVWMHPNYNVSDVVEIIIQNITHGFSVLYEVGFPFDEAYLAALKNESTYISSLTNLALRTTHKEKSLAGITMLQENIKYYLDIVSDRSLRSIASVIGLSTDNLLKLLQNSAPAPYYWECVATDIALLNVSRNEILDGIAAYSMEILAKINS